MFFRKAPKVDDGMTHLLKVKTALLVIAFDEDRRTIALPVGKYRFVYVTHPYNDKAQALKIIYSDRIYHVTKDMIDRMPATSYEITELEKTN